MEIEEKITPSTVNETASAPVLTKEEEAVLKTMMEAGLFYGLNRSKTNPKMKAYLASTKSGIEIINLVETMKSLKTAFSVVKEKVKAGGLPLIIGTTPAVKESVRELGVKYGVPYVTERWLGGTLTNFKTILSRNQFYKKLKSDKENGRLEKYTKKERLNIEKEMAKLGRLFSGLEIMDRLPAVAIIFDLKNHELAARETRRMNITSVAVSNTNADPEMVDYPIVSNDRNPQSISFIASYLGKAIEEGKKEALEVAKVKENKGENGKN